ERGRCAEIDTGHTTAHLTMVTDLRLAELVDRFGRNHAQAVWDAGLAAIAQIDTIVKDEHLSCAFTWVPGALHQLRRGGPRPERQRSRRAVLGHRGSLSLCTSRSAARFRRRDRGR